MSEDILAEEKWMPLFSWFEVSDMGNFRSYWFKVCMGIGGGKGSKLVLSTTHHPIKKFFKRRDGRYSVTLTVNGKRAKFMVAPLVLVAHKGARPYGMECCHNNGIKTDDRADNLRWDTPMANTADKYEHGTVFFGEKNYQASMSDDGVRSIMRFMLDWWPQHFIVRLFGISRYTASSIANGRSWSKIYEEMGGENISEKLLRKRG